MTSAFEKNPATRATDTRDDPWARATLLPDNSQNAWLVSYIDILMLLVTLLVVLLTLQKGALPTRTTEPKATTVAARVQAHTDRTPPSIRHWPRAEADGLKQENATRPVQTLPQESRSLLYRTAMQPVPPVLETPVAAPSPMPPEAEEAKANENLSAQNVASRPDQRVASASQTVQWSPPDGLEDQVEMVREAEQIRLEVNDAVLFESGSAELKAQGMAVLEQLVDMLQRHPGRISVEGHTDDQPITTPRYPSNWELSAARASTVARYLIRRGIVPDRLRTIGYADTRPRSDNASAAGRARNRRVTLVMYPRQP